MFHKAIPFQQIPRKGNKLTQALEGWGVGGVRQTSQWIPDTHLIAVTVKMLTFSLWAVSCKLHCPWQGQCFHFPLRGLGH